MNTLLFLRHAKTKVDKSVPIEHWILTEEGTTQSRELATQKLFDDVDILISSDEEKAYLTIKPLADRLGKPIVRVTALGEIQRPNSEKLTAGEYDEMKVRIFKDLDYTAHGWETANHALNRFSNAVKEIERKYDGKKILICSHGTVMTLYFASIQRKMDELFNRWESLDFGSYGVVKGGNVVRDIV